MSNLTTAALVGRWVSPKREPIPTPDGGTIYLVRDFTFTPTAWHLLCTIYGHAEADVKLFSATVDGGYWLESPSQAAPGATEAAFGFSVVKQIAYVPAFADIFNQMGSGNGQWKIGEEQDISKTGSMTFHKVSEYPKEYDLLKLDGDKLYLGARPADNNMGSPSLRPKTLTPHPLVKQP